MVRSKKYLIDAGLFGSQEACEFHLELFSFRVGNGDHFLRVNRGDNVVEHHLPRSRAQTDGR